MRKTGVIISALFFLFVNIVHAQDSVYVTWTATAKKISDKEYELHLKGSVKPGWHIYTQDKQSEGLEGLKISFKDSPIKHYNLFIINLLRQDRIFKSLCIWLEKNPNRVT